MSVPLTKSYSNGVHPAYVDTKSEDEYPLSDLKEISSFGKGLDINFIRIDRKDGRSEQIHIHGQEYAKIKQQLEWLVEAQKAENKQQEEINQWEQKQMDANHGTPSGDDHDPKKPNDNNNSNSNNNNNNNNNNRNNSNNNNNNNNSNNNNNNPTPPHPRLVKESLDDAENILRLAGKYATQASVIQRVVKFQRGTPSQIRESLMKLHDLGLIIIWKNDNFAVMGDAKEQVLSFEGLVDLIVSVLSSVMVTPGLKTLLSALKESITASVEHVMLTGSSGCNDFKVLYETDYGQVMMFSYKFTKTTTQDKKAIKFIITWRNAVYHMSADLFSMSFSLDPTLYLNAALPILIQSLRDPLPADELEVYQLSEEIKRRIKTASLPPTQPSSAIST